MRQLDAISVDNFAVKIGDSISVSILKQVPEDDVVCLEYWDKHC